MVYRLQNQSTPGPVYWRSDTESSDGTRGRPPPPLEQRRPARSGQTLGELCEHLDMTRQAVSKHLDLLEEANLVVVIWRGREKLHYLNPVPIHDIADRWISKFDRDRLRVLAELKKQLEGDGNG